MYEILISKTVIAKKMRTGLEAEGGCLRVRTWEIQITNINLTAKL